MPAAPAAAGGVDARAGAWGGVEAARKGEGIRGIDRGRADAGCTDAGAGDDAGRIDAGGSDVEGSTDVGGSDAEATDAGGSDAESTGAAETAGAEGDGGIDTVAFAASLASAAGSTESVIDELKAARARASRWEAARSTSAFDFESRRVKRSVRPGSAPNAFCLYATTRPSPRSSAVPFDSATSNRRMTPCGRDCDPTSVTLVRVSVSSSCSRNSSSDA